METVCTWASIFAPYPTITSSVRCSSAPYRLKAGEKVELLRTFGAEVIQVKTASIANPEHYINVAARLARERPGYVFMDQFETEANLKAHLAHTGPEIWEQTNGR